MALRLTERARKGLVWILVMDALAFLAALYHQFNATLASHGGEQEATRLFRAAARMGARWAWILLAVMMAATIVYCVLSLKREEEEEIIHGLPPESSGLSDWDEDT